MQPPVVQFKEVLFHPNIGPSGTLDIPMLDAENWTLDKDIKKILIAIREILDNPDFGKSIRVDVDRIWDDGKGKDAYWQRVRQQARTLMNC